jgi:response regulator of citrate/malate metabolism
MCDMAQGIQTVEDEEIITAMREHPDPAFTTFELAEEFDMSSEGMRHRLEQIREDGPVRKKKPTKRTVIWWVKWDQPEPLSVA